MMHITNNRIWLKDGSLPHFSLTYFLMQACIWTCFVFFLLKKEFKLNDVCSQIWLKYCRWGRCSAAVLPWPRTTAGAPRPVMSRCWRRHMSDATRGDGAGRHGVTWVVSRGARTNFSVSVAVIPWGAVTWPGMARHRNNIAAAFSEITLICRHVSNVCHWQCCKIFGEDAYHRFQPLKICKSVINGCLTWQKPPVTPPRPGSPD